jgi:carbamoyl-phosphate synthase large subunit
VPIIGTSPAASPAPKTASEFRELVKSSACSSRKTRRRRLLEEAEVIADRIGYPVVVRPSFVLGGRAMEIVYDREALDRYMTPRGRSIARASGLIDKFLEGAIEFDVDACATGRTCRGGHHAAHRRGGGSLRRQRLHPAALRPRSGHHRRDEGADPRARPRTERGRPDEHSVRRPRRRHLPARGQSPRLAHGALREQGHGVPLAKLAARVMAGKTLRELGIHRRPRARFVSAKEVVLPFIKFPGVDILLGPEMRSTGEVMGIDMRHGHGLRQEPDRRGQPRPAEGTVFISLNDRDKENMGTLAQDLADWATQSSPPPARPKLP